MPLGGKTSNAVAQQRLLVRIRKFHDARPPLKAARRSNGRRGRD
jgi:hypothetical protein